MPQIVTVSDFRANIKSVSRFTDAGEVVILTQNGRPRWAMVDYDTWNATARVQERSFSKAILETEQRESAGTLKLLSSDEARAALRARRQT